MIKKLQLVLQPSWSLKLPTRAYNNDNTINSQQYTKSRLYSPAVKSDNLHLISAFYATCVIAILCDVHVYQAQIFTAQSMCIEQYMPWLSNYPNPPHFWHVHVRVRHMLSPVRLSVICLSSVTFVRPTQPAMFLCHFVPWTSADIHGKFYGDRPRGTPPLRVLSQI